MVSLSVFAQTTPEEVKSDLNKSGGVYYAYPTVVAVSTPAPDGYKPFHISHYGRHGSRYLISDNDYRQVSELLHRANDANALTPLGKDVMMRVD
ncbi:MAG: histidine-type phosphatase, partial [Muribaculaceae bacterium]|nr:histidine-type phosphatase [Muribaculaceae bacterium]